MTCSKKKKGGRPVLGSCKDGCPNGWTITPATPNVTVTTDSEACTISIGVAALYQVDPSCCTPSGSTVVLEGAPGPQGLTGNPGPQGVGIQGPAGPAGADGKDGADGETPVIPDTSTGMVKYVRPFLVNCTVNGENPVSTKLCMAWVTKSGNMFIVTSHGDGVVLSSTAGIYATLEAAITAADGITGAWNCG